MKFSSMLLFFTGAACALAANNSTAPGAARGPRGPQPAGCAGTGLALAARAGQCDPACATLLNPTGPVGLTADARTALLFQIDEERMAGELYVAFAARWDLRPFQNIPRAEAQHQAALTALATRAGLAVAATVPGQFASAEVQKRYDALLAVGLESADSALRTGAFVEEQGIADLRSLAATADSAELKQVVTALETASGHHLGAFVRSLAARGIIYTAQVLGADEVAALTRAAPGRGGMGGGAGRGYRGGRGQR